MSTFLLLLRRGIKRGFITLWRERGWGTTLASLTGILLIAQLLLTSALAAQAMERLVRSETDLRLEILDGAVEKETLAFFSAIKALPYVADVQYVTKEKAYDIERAQDPDLVSFLEKFNLKNPFPDTLAVTLQSLDDYDRFAQFVRGSEWRSVVDPGFLSKSTDQETRIHELISLTQAMRFIALFFLGLIAIVLLFVVMELVRRRALMRSEEVFIERLFGAQDLAILLPFIVESTLLLFISLFFTALLLAILLYVLPVYLLPMVDPTLTQGATIVALGQQLQPLITDVLPLIIGAEFLLVPVTACLGAWLGLAPQLRSKKLIVTGI